MILTRALTRLALALSLALAIATLVTLAPDRTAAATFDVTDPGDDIATPGTLRWAIAQANADATPPIIHIAPGLSIDLTCAGGGELVYDNPGGHPLTLEGNGATITQTCPGHAAITSIGDDLHLTRVTLTGGTNSAVRAGGDIEVVDSHVHTNSGGAAIAAFTGTATVQRSLIEGNEGGIGGGVAGIHAIVESSTIAGNEATNGAGIWVDQTAQVTNSTIVGNEASGAGGGIYATLSDVTLVHATLVGNEAPDGANLAMAFPATLTAYANVIATSPGADVDCALVAGTAVVSQGGNFTSDATCGLESGPGDQPDAGDPGLAALGDHGGATPTRMPTPGSPLLDVVDCDAPLAEPTDQRGVSRPQGSGCDAGAVELEVADAEGPDGAPARRGASRPATPVPAVPTFTG